MENQGIEINLSKEKSEEFFYNALCNGLDYFGSYGVFIELDMKAYKKAKSTLNKKGVTSTCHEDVLMEILRNGDTIKFIDEECDGEYSRDLTLEMVHNNVGKTDVDHLMNMITENDDATTADVIIQAVLYDGETIFG